MRILILLFSLSVICLCEGSSSDRVRLQDVTAITLYAGKMTRGRRVDPVPQIKCVGWCPIAEPRTASCVNRGFDGYDVQWECKADLDDGFQFDNVEVLCEGYDYSNDPYILRGSCGLEYTLRASSNTQKAPHGFPVKEKSSGFKDLIPFIAGLFLIWALYKTCIAPAMNDNRHDRSSTNDDYPDDGTSGPRMGWNIPGFGGGLGGGGLGGGGFSSGPDYYNDASCGAGARRRGGGGNGAGFWTGLATGGMMGYMFGNRNTTPTYHQPTYTQPSSSFFGSGSSSLGGGSFSSGGSHSSTGFGGTRRR